MKSVHRLLPAAMLLTLGPAVLLSGCQRVPFSYAPEIQQGNVITEEMVAQLRPEMTEREVLFVMGSPVLRHGALNERWDYVHGTGEGGAAPYERLTLVFGQDRRLAEVNGDLAPAGWR